MNKLDPSYAMNQSALMQMFDAIDTRLKNMCLSAAGLVIDTDKTKFKIANTVTYLVNGVFKSKTTAAVAFTATDHDIAADAGAIKEACYLVSLQADGTPVVTMGAIATGAGKAVLPAIDRTATPIGYVRISVKAGSTKFDATSDNLDAAHINAVTYVDLGYLAPRFDAVL